MSDLSNFVKENIRHATTHLLIESGREGWYLVWPDGTRYDGQAYARAQDARRAITLMKKESI